MVITFQGLPLVDAVPGTRDDSVFDQRLVQELISTEERL